MNNHHKITKYHIFRFIFSISFYVFGGGITTHFSVQNMIIWVQKNFPNFIMLTVHPLFHICNIFFIFYPSEPLFIFGLGLELFQGGWYYWRWHLIWCSLAQYKLFKYLIQIKLNRAFLLINEIKLISADMMHGKFNVFVGSNWILSVL